MAESPDTIPSVAQILTLNQLVFAAGHYSAAYHLLSAAFYLAGEDVQYLAIVQQVAEEQLMEIDATHPEYEHSTDSAKNRRRQASIFRLLARQAQAQRNHVMLRQLLKEQSTELKGMNTGLGQRESPRSQDYQ
jgi:hypothetical protein